MVAAAVAKKAENDENMTFGKCEVVFTDLMNKKAEELGATNSHFANAHGYIPMTTTPARTTLR